MSRDVEVKNTTTIMSHNDKGEQDLEPNRWDSEEFTKPAIKLTLVLDMPLHRTASIRAAAQSSTGQLMPES